MRARQLERVSDAEQIQFLADTPANAQISSTGWRMSSASVRFGFPGVRASTPLNCGHSLEAHCADLASVLGRANAGANRQSGSGQNVGTQPVPEVLKVLTAIDAGQIEEHFIDGVLLDSGRHFLKR